MKKLFYLLSLSMMGLTYTQAEDVNALTNRTRDIAYIYSEGVEVDVNNDGYLDFLVGGSYKGDGGYGTYYNQLLLWSQSNNFFVKSTTNFIGGTRQFCIPADMDGDGIMDIVMAHGTYPAYSGGIFKGRGDGNFDIQAMTFDVGGYVFQPHACAVADVNNDGLPDIITAKDDYNAILINQGNYSFQVTQQDLFPNPIAFPMVKVLDYDNDGYTDILVFGDRGSTNGGYFTEIYKNGGLAAPGIFTAINLMANYSFPTYYKGSVLIQDFDSDGYLDLVFNAMETSSACYTKYFKNNQAGGFTQSVQAVFIPSVRNENTTPTQASCYDWNNDGYPDAIFTAKDYVSTEYVTYAYMNNQTGDFLAASTLPGSIQASVSMLDYDGDGDRDMVIVGRNGALAADYCTIINVNNNGANIRPTPPSSLNAAVIRDTVTLTWAAGADSKTPVNALSYEIYIKDESGKIYGNCRSHIGGALDGVRKVLSLGNAYLNKESVVIGLPDGDYSWGVQTIDASFDGSTFATGTFTVDRTVTELEPSWANKFRVTILRNTITVKIDGQASVKIYDVSGKVVTHAEFNDSYSTNLQKGLYLVSVMHNGIKKIQKVIL